MASILKVDELQGIVSAGDITVTSEGGAATQSLQQGLAKAWATHTQSATYTLHDSLNISSLTDNFVGETFYNWASNFGNAFYSATVGVGEYAVAYNNTPALGVTSNGGKTTALLKWHSQTIGNAPADLPDNNLTVHGDLA